MFINLTNHPSSSWGDEQLAAARRYGEVVDYPFPLVDPLATSEDVVEQANAIAAEVGLLEPEAVLCQGESTLAYHLVRVLKQQGVSVLAACTNRKVVAKTACGETNKYSIFVFVQFREY